MTRTVGGIPLCSADERTHTIREVAVERIEGDVDIEFIGLRRTLYRDAEAPADAPETTAGSMEGSLDRRHYEAPEGFEVSIPCDSGPELLELALEYTPRSDDGAVLDGIRVSYDDASGRQRAFVIDRIVVGCGDEADPQAYEQDCADADR